MYSNFVKNVNNLSVLMTFTGDGNGTNMEVCVGEQTAV